ncbi:MAG: FeoB-associated Cys-rich membrane protein [Clostridia bacterium]|nr:FeoB-associated Cys-rich membrane protein [Clostridia bacterium]
MLEWLSANMGTISVGIIVLAVILLAFFSVVKDKKNGKNCSSCGGGCNGCCGCTDCSANVNSQNISE